MAAACHPSRSAPPPPGAPAVAVATPSTSGMQRAEDFAVEQAMRLEQEVINLKSQLAIERRRGLPAESAKHEREVAALRAEIGRLKARAGDDEADALRAELARGSAAPPGAAPAREAQKEARRATRLYRERRDRDRRAKEDELRREAAAAKGESPRSEGRGARKVVVKVRKQGGRPRAPPWEEQAILTVDASTYDDLRRRADRGGGRGRRRGRADGAAADHAREVARSHGSYRAALKGLARDVEALREADAAKCAALARADGDVPGAPRRREPRAAGRDASPAPRGGRSPPPPQYPFVGNRRTPPPGRKPAFVDDDADESPRPRHLAPTASARSPYLAPQLRKKPANHPQNRAAKKRPTNGGFK
ncbi:nuclear localization sequence binding protein [Aureococcus anophagefferens]|uniref:Nuclear localization sequence binding protein n=1 Tax=Aureococcus anophagefferens TaxID=44056 RepID=A0ABR1FSL1_AURAN